MTPTIYSLAIEVDRASQANLSNHQFELLAQILLSSDDPRKMAEILIIVLKRR